ncbi:MAG: flavodoxin [Chitinophagales bacterium]|nr:flavodoxin [Chitinophagales bacterium]
MAANLVVEKVKAMLGDDSIDIHEIYQKTGSDMSVYNLIIIGMPTWYDGELQGDWEEYIPEIKEIDFSGKKVAFFGLGDQYGYASFFCDGIGIFAEFIENQGGELCGFTSTSGFEHDFSKAERGDQFVGLCLDVDNQDELTDERVEGWIPQVLEEFGLLVKNEN